MVGQQQLVQLLADGELHSGSELAGKMGITRSAVWKQIRQLEAIELDVSAQAGLGYQLEMPLELLDQSSIESLLAPATRGICGAPRLFWVTESTSNLLLDEAPPEPGRAHVCITEYQSAGRGRRGRSWFAPAGHGLCLSVSWTFPESPANFSCLGLAAGVAVMDALRAAGADNAELKWPNDVVANGRKLAGILVDVRGEAGGPMHAVVGVGVNYRLNERAARAVAGAGGLEPISVEEAAGSAAAGRNRTAALLIDELCDALRVFGSSGFEPFVDKWGSADYLAGRSVLVAGDDGEKTGIARGITDDGRLRLEKDGQEVLLVTGDISVRPRL
jgi:BirA family biotin operon repressor/biotin-[acetyl-CoA-carboxylase] ligase